LSFLFFVIGNQFNGFIKNLIITDKKNAISPIFEIVIGCSILAFILTISNFFIRINIEIFIIINVGVVFLLFYSRNNILSKFRQIQRTISGLSFFKKALLCLALFLMAFNGSDLPIYNLDEGRYHFQALLWVKSYPIIPGLANIEPRFGTASSWYCINAFFDIFFLKGKSYHIVNSYIFLLLYSYCIIHLPSNKKQLTVYTLTICFSFLFLLYTFLFIRYYYLIGVTPDAGVNVYIILAFLFLLKNFNKMHEDYYVFYFTLFSLTGFLFRLSGVFLVFVAGLFWLRQIKEKTYKLKNVFYTPILLVLFTTLIITRSTILTGWGLFPITSIDLFNFDWKVPKELVDSASYTFTNHMFPNWEQINYNELGFLYRLKTIYIHLIFNSYFHVNALVFLSIISFLLAIGFSYKERKFPVYPSLISIIVFIIFYISAPLLRFGLGYTCMAFSIPIATALYYFLHFTFLKFTKNFFVLLISIAVSVALIMGVMYTVPVSLKDHKLNYPIQLISFLLNKDLLVTLRPVPTVDICSYPLNNGLNVNVAKCDFSFLSKGYSSGILPTTGCANYTVKDKNGYSLVKNCITCNDQKMDDFLLTVGVMPWISPLPTVGGLCSGFEFRGKSTLNGFRSTKGIIK